MKVRLLPPFISGEYKIDDTLRNSSEELLRYRQHLTIKLNVLLWYLGTLQPECFFPIILLRKGYTFVFRSEEFMASGF